MTVQLVTRVPDDLAVAIDLLVERGDFASRSEVVRTALEAVVAEAHRRAIGESIVAGYRRIPQVDDDLGWSDAATAAMIAEEPW